jgi:hypothetical protein
LIALWADPFSTLRSVKVIGDHEEQILRTTVTGSYPRPQLDQVCLEHCTLSYDMITLWDTWDFTGEFAVGVIDQRSDGIESDEEVARRAGRRWLVFRRNASFLPRSVVFSTFRSMSPGRSCAGW